MNVTKKATCDRVKQCRLCKRLNAFDRINGGASIHCGGQVSPIFRDGQDEYQRLAQQPLLTLVAKVIKFCDSLPDQRYLTLITTVINGKSFAARSKDISTDSIINRSDYLAINETWMEDSCSKGSWF
ncbi:hypothetical protein TNCV_1916931 [Trichonephila clavipes]|uniref:Uncharacterized protein n=1 Tax=Trichonephila clavipes TaxID=2585209 RepID=A0A8X6W0D4_TRICX|nr:hypothetical protein TNCV_1916931 [Trichonephila clavipes]